MDVLNTVKSSVTGYILAGGDSKRLGRDKRKVMVSGTTLLTRTIGILNDLLGIHPYLVGNNLDGFGIPAEFMIKDAKENSGPLAGLVAALEHCATEWALILAVDLPKIKVEDLKVLLASADRESSVIAISEGGLPEPLIALYNKRTLEYWEDRLNDNLLSISEGLVSLGYKKVIPPGGREILHNVNNPEDLEKR